MIYLASPFFQKHEINTYNKIIESLRNKGYDVFVPREHEIPDGEKMPNSAWGKAVFDMDMEALRNCSAVVALNWGLYSDSGTAWECGAAYALGKPVLQVICGHQEEAYSCMMLSGATAYCYDYELIIAGYTVEELLQGKSCAWVEQK